MLSTPPATNTSPSPHLVARAAALIAARPEEQRRLNVTAATETGKPARRVAMRATFRLSSPASFAPHTRSEVRFPVTVPYRPPSNATGGTLARNGPGERAKSLRDHVIIQLLPAAPDRSTPASSRSEASGRVTLRMGIGASQTPDAAIEYSTRNHVREESTDETVTLFTT